MSFNNAPSYIAKGTIAPCSFVKVYTTAGVANDNAVVQAGAGDKCVGISQQGMKRMPGLPGSDTTIAAESGDTLRVYGLGDDCLLQLGGTVTRGDFLKSDASGYGVTGSSGDECGAEALEAGISGVRIRVLIVNRKA